MRGVSIYASQLAHSCNVTTLSLVFSLQSSSKSSISLSLSLSLSLIHFKILSGPLQLLGASEIHKLASSILARNRLFARQQNVEDLRKKARTRKGAFFRSSRGDERRVEVHKVCYCRRWCCRKNLHADLLHQQHFPNCNFPFIN